MSKSELIAAGIYIIGGPNISHAEDATVFVIDCGSELVMIDSGAGGSVRVLEENIKKAKLDPTLIKTIILTHCHIDHIGGAPYFRDKYESRIFIHELDAPAVEEGDRIRTAASWYGTVFTPTLIDHKFRGDCEELLFGSEKIYCFHTPGHTPGSISVYLDRDGQRILFGQDIHGPFLPAFGSNIAAWRESMNKLLALRADILCEGHYGIFQPREQVEKYILKYLGQY